LVTLFARLNIPIAACGRNTAVGACIVVVLVAIVAAFNTCMLKPVAADVERAAGCTLSAVGITCPVVACFVAFSYAVTANRLPGICAIPWAGIAADIIAIIAKFVTDLSLNFIGSHNVVPALGLQAGKGAAVVVDGVTIITAFVT
jgi:hypothetical protein